jgi:hypothetical protein
LGQRGQAQVKAHTVGADAVLHPGGYFAFQPQGDANEAEDDVHHNHHGRGVDEELRGYEVGLGDIHTLRG